MQKIVSMNAPVLLDSDSVLVVKPYQTEILHECCDCGLRHRILISPRETDFRMQFIRVDGEFDYSKYDIETHIEKPKP